MSKNDITGDEIKTKVQSNSYTDNWERIFGKKNIAAGKAEAQANADAVRAEKLNCDEYPFTCFCHDVCEKQRQKAIAQNGNEGLHYKQDNLPLNEYPEDDDSAH
jgi:hypothetical protein